MVLAGAVILAGCGGGGGGTTPAANPTKRALITPLLGEPTNNVVSSRVAIKAIVQVPAGTMDPYFHPDCVPGTTAGGCHADSNNNLVNVLQNDVSVHGWGITAFNRRIKGPLSNNPSITVPNPPLDVRTAWHDGWTGKGVNILIMDGFLVFGEVTIPTNPIKPNDRDPRGTHGYTVLMSARQIAPRATFYGLEVSVSAGEKFPVLARYRQGGLRLADTNQEISPTTGTIPEIQVVNLSLGAEIIRFDTITASVLGTDFERYTRDPKLQDIAGTAGTPLSRALADAVITKFAGNSDGADSAYFMHNVRLISTRPANPSKCASTGNCANTRNRALIVGALDRFADSSSRALMAGYSNVAGQFEQMQERFLVEYGGSPYSGIAFLCDKSLSTTCNHQQDLLKRVTSTTFSPLEALPLPLLELLALPHWCVANSPT